MTSSTRPGLTFGIYPGSAVGDAGSGIFCQFGLMTDDYSPKPAFHLYRDLISALS